MSKTKVTHLVCDICSKKKAIGNNYYKSSRPEYKSYNNYCSVCKLCLRDLSIDKNLNKVTPEKIKVVLKYLDAPYIKSVFISVMSNEETANKNFIGRYRRALNLSSEYKNCNYADSVRFEILEQERQNAKVEDKMVSALEIDDDMRMFWGLGLEDDAYIYMQTMFKRLTRHEKKIDHKKESDYKTLCIYEWQKSTIQYDIDQVNKLEKLQKMIDTLSNGLGIQARQRQEEESNERFTIGLITRYYEDVKKKPIKRWVEDLGNIDLMKSMLEVHYKGGIMHALQIPNPDIEKYEREIEEFTVKIEAQTGDEDE